MYRIRSPSRLGGHVLERAMLGGGLRLGFGDTRLGFRDTRGSVLHGAGWCGWCEAAGVVEDMVGGGGVRCGPHDRFGHLRSGLGGHGRSEQARLSGLARREQAAIVPAGAGTVRGGRCRRPQARFPEVRGVAEGLGERRQAGRGVSRNCMVRSASHRRSAGPSPKARCRLRSTLVRASHRLTPSGRSAVRPVSASAMARTRSTYWARVRWGRSTPVGGECVPHAPSSWRGLSLS